MRDRMFVNIIAASRHPLEKSHGIKPIITLHARYPRFIHSEIMTHRTFSRNARSSRAVPIARMIEEVRTNPVVPWHWGKNQSGMQALEECNEMVSFTPVDAPNDSTIVVGEREATWLKARDYAVSVAEGFMEAGYHKQIVNRLLEPFMWIDTLITSTEWDNFFDLRCHQDAEPHFQDLANMMREAIEGAEYADLEACDWHLPYVLDEEKAQYDPDTLLKLSAARCARISYKPFDGNGDIESELARFDRLINSKPMHASPIEHQAITDIYWDYQSGNFNDGWGQYRKLVEQQEALSND